jgi:small subunit ribosomal protein S21
MAKIIVREGETIEQALRRFNREVQKARIMDELRRREFYEKPSVVKKREEAQRKRRSERNVK